MGLVSFLLSLVWTDCKFRLTFSIKVHLKIVKYYIILSVYSEIALRSKGFLLHKPPPITVPYVLPFMVSF